MKGVHELSRRAARRIAVRAQLLTGPRPADLLEVARHLGLLQADPTSAVTTSAHLVVWSRLGSAYDPAELECMVRRGDVAVAGRDGRERLWDLAVRVYPDDPRVPREEALRIRNVRRLRSLGIARAKGPECPVEPIDVHEAGEPAVVEGVRGRWRVDPTYLDLPFTGRTVLLSPLDRLVFDRKRMVELFEFDYQLEMYKPVAKRRWGYWALPILYGDRLVGKLDATADRNAGVLRVDAIHEDGEWSRTMRAAVGKEVRDLARWLGLKLFRARN